MLGCCLALLLLSLGRLLSGLLLGGFCGLLLCSSTRNCTGGCTDRRTLARITCNCSNGCASCCTLGRALYRSTLWRILSSLLSRLLLCSLLLLGTGRRRWGRFRINPALLLSGAIALILILELLIGALTVLRICEDPDALSR